MGNNNITASEFTTGNLDSIDFLAGIIGDFVVIIISIVGFGIVMSAISKNAFAGLYATNSKFWDRVDEAHKAGSGIAIKGSNIFQVIGSLGTFALSKFPNIKAMTDFEDEVLDAKAYFMKALPLACIQILIGVFIFKGYPTEVANKFTDFGTGMFDVVLTNVDPKAWVEKLPDKLAILQFSTDGAKDDFSKNVNKAAKSVAKSYIGALDDMTKEKRISIAQDLENWVIDTMRPNCIEYCNKDKYKMSVTSTICTAEPNVDYVNNKVVDGIATFAFYKNMSDWSSGSTKDTSSMWIRYDLVFTPVASKGDSAQVDCNMTVPTGGSFSANTDGNYITITISNDVTNGYSIAGLDRAEGFVSVGGNEYKVKISVTGNVITVKPASKGQVITGANAITGISNLFYVYNSDKYPIRNIYTGGNSVTFSAVDAESGISNWQWGSAPSATESTPANTNTDSTPAPAATVTDTGI